MAGSELPGRETRFEVSVSMQKVETTSVRTVPDIRTILFSIDVTGESEAEAIDKAKNVLGVV